VTTTRPVVVDASVAIAVVLDEAAGLRAEQALRGWASNDRSIFVPTHFWLEIVNVVGGGGRVAGERVLAAVHRLDVFGLQTVEANRGLLVRVIDRVERLHLSVYDAMYLALAESVDADLATLDRRLAVAAGPRAITFDEGHGLHETPAVYERDVTWPSYKGASAYLAKLRAETLAERT
jgi:predicted nucleic acid-binding protein